MSAYSIERLIWFVRFMLRHRGGVAKSVIDQAWVNSGYNEIYNERPDTKNKDGKTEPDNSSNEGVDNESSTPPSGAEKKIPKPRKLVSQNVMPRQTFNRYREKALDLFGMNIVYNSYSKTYHIEDFDDYRKDSLKNWLVDTYGVFEYVQRNSKLQQNLMYEDIPSGRTYLDSILQAISRCNPISFNYNDFEGRSSLYGRSGNYRNFRPYGLRLYGRRWYLIGFVNDIEWLAMVQRVFDIKDEEKRHEAMARCEDIDYWVLPLDRISNLEVNTDRTFETPVVRFDIKEFFNDYVGPYVDSFIPKETIVLITTHLMGKRLETLPIHHSQKKVSSDEAERCVFELELRPTHYFYAEILKLGSDVRIESPKWVVDQMREHIKNMAENYAAKDPE